MKKSILLGVILIVALSCNVANKVKISGTISGLETTDSVLTIRGHNINKSISISKKGAFTDELELKEAGKYDFFINKSVQFPIFLKNGYTLSVTADAKNLQNSISFKGEGEETNNFIQESGREYSAFMQNYKNYLKLDKADFTLELDKLKSKMNTLLANKKIDTVISTKIAASLDNAYTQLAKQYHKANMPKIDLSKGGTSPQFYNYENDKGGKTSMDDLSGKYIYIDVWATWCRPCVAQIPSLIQLEKEFRGKNIEFVSISTDRPNAHDKWKQMIVDKGMAGTQLFMGKDRSFMDEFQIRGIPRFIFIDPKGKIINANAPRPSQKAAVVKMFKEAGL